MPLCGRSEIFQCSVMRHLYILQYCWQFCQQGSFGALEAGSCPIQKVEISQTFDMSTRKLTGARFTLSKLLVLVAATAAFIGIPRFCEAISQDMALAALFVAYAFTLLAFIAIPVSCLLTFVVLVTPESSKELYWNNLSKAFKLSLCSLLLLAPIASFGFHYLITAR